MRLLLPLLFCLFGQITDSLASQQWQQRANFGNFARHRGTGIAIGNKAYCGLGHLNGTGIDTRLADWWEFDPATNAWSQKSDYPGNFGNGDQDVVIMGLETVAFAGLGEMDDTGFYKFDAQTNTWTQVSSPPGGTFHNMHAFSIGHKGYFPVLYGTQIYEYDADIDVWTLLNPLPFSTSFGIPSFSIGDKGYLKNGANFYEYDPSTDSWMSKAIFPGTTPNRPKGVAHDNYGYFIGGMDASWTWSAEVWRYDQANDTWLQLDEFPGTVRRWATALNIGNKIYYGMGTNGTNFNDWWEFNPVAGIEEFNVDQFKVFPNLASDHVNFTSENYQNFEIVLYDLQGKAINSTSAINGKARLERESVTSGTYIYHVLIDGNAVHSDRIIFI